jgi:flagellar P-ring protein FlgI
MRILVVLLGLLMALPAAAQQVPLKAIGRFDGWRENALIGYGLVTGLAGSGDSRRNAVTRQALRNVLLRLGTTVSEEDISSRNVAVVTVVARLPAANVGDRLDAVVSSIGDARSLAGGTLLMTALIGPDQRTYALAQGPIVAGGYNFEANLNLQQGNYPTSAVLQGGATVEVSVDASIVKSDGDLAFLLNEPSFDTANVVAGQVNARFGAGSAVVSNADEVRIRFRRPAAELASFVATLENLHWHRGGRRQCHDFVGGDRAG